MYLYHYSKSKYPKLLTSRRSGRATPEQIKEAEEGAAFREDIGAYCDHISFFFDPVPLDIIGDIFQNNHHTWVNGHKLYQYKVNTKYLERSIGYKVVESPLSVEFLDKMGWQEDDEWKKKFFRERNKLQRAAGEIGHTRVGLDQQCEKFAGTTREFYIKLSQRPDFEEYRGMYAACVPHVQIYPTSGIVNYESVNLVTVGKRFAAEKWTDW